MNQSANGTQQNWLKAGQYYTDDVGQVVFYFNSNDYMKLTAESDDYATITKYFSAQDVANATRTNPIPIVSLTADFEHEARLTIECNPKYVTNITSISCAIYTPLSTAITLNTSTHGYARTLYLPTMSTYDTFELVYCEYPQQISSGTCDFNQHQGFNMTITVNGITATHEFFAYNAPAGEDFFLQNGTGFALFTFPTASEKTERIIWFLIALIVGILASVAIQTETKAAGMHAFFITMIVGAAVTASFLWVTFSIATFYGLKIMQANWEE